MHLLTSLLTSVSHVINEFLMYSTAAECCGNIEGYDDNFLCICNTRNILRAFLSHSFCIPSNEGMNGIGVMIMTWLFTSYQLALRSQYFQCCVLDVCF